MATRSSTKRSADRSVLLPLAPDPAPPAGGRGRACERRAACGVRLSPRPRSRVRNALLELGNVTQMLAAARGIDDAVFGAEDRLARTRPRLGADDAVLGRDDAGRPHRDRQLNGGAAHQHSSVALRRTPQ